MRVRMGTVIVDREFRRRLRMYLGKPGLATREEVRSWRETNGKSCDNDMFQETEEEDDEIENMW